MPHINKLNAQPQLGLKNKNYVAIQIQDLACKALVDSGNLFGNVMSKDYFMALGFNLNDLEPLHTPIGTAQQGQALAVLGRAKRPMYLNINGIPTNFKTRPVIIDRLSMPFIISAPFLSKYGFDQLF